MTAILLIMIFAGAMFSLLFFGGAPLSCIGAALAAAALFVVQVFLFRDSGLKKKLVPVGALLLLIACLFQPSRPTAYGFYDHLKLFDSYSSLLSAGKSEKAAAKYEALTEKYGEDDESRFLCALDQIARGDIAGAEDTAAAFSNKKLPVYYLLQEKIIAQKYVSNEELSEHLRPLYIEAADKYPEWSYVTKNAGILLFAKGEYEKAGYYLTNAFSFTEEEDADLCYYLGASLCEQGVSEKALPLFNKAVELGVDEEKQASIKWYLDKVGWEG